MTTTDSTYNATEIAAAYVSGDTEAFATAYRAVHASRRTAAQREILRAAVGMGADPMDVLTAIENVPTAPTARTSSVISDDRANVLRSSITAIMAASVELFMEEPGRFPSENVGELDDLDRAYIARMASSAVSAARSLPTGSRVVNSNPATGKRWTIADLVNLGRLSADDELTFTYRNKVHTAAVVPTDDGYGLRIRSGAGRGTYSNPSTAAEAVVNSTTGKDDASRNGWDDWQFAGRPVGALRSV